MLTKLKEIGVHPDVIKLVSLYDKERMNIVEYIVNEFSQDKATGNITVGEMNYALMRCAFYPKSFNVSEMSLRSQAEYMKLKREIEMNSVMNLSDTYLLEIVGLLTPNNYGHQMTAYLNAITLSPEQPEITYLVQSIINELELDPYKPVNKLGGK